MVCAEPTQRSPTVPEAGGNPGHRRDERGRPLPHLRHQLGGEVLEYSHISSMNRLITYLALAAISLLPTLWVHILQNVMAAGKKGENCIKNGV